MGDYMSIHVSNKSSVPATQTPIKTDNHLKIKLKDIKVNGPVVKGTYRAP